MKRNVWFMVIISVLLVFTGTSTVKAATGQYTNAFYAIDSYRQLGYTVHADQVALSWGEIRSMNDTIYFTQQKYEVNPVRASEYGVPKGDINALIRQMKSQGNKLMLSVFLVDSPSTGSMLRKILDSEQLQNRIIEDIVAALQVIKAYNYDATPDSSGTYPSRNVTDSQGKPIGYDGLIIDFEQLFDRYDDKPEVSYRDKFTSFLRKLKDRMPADKALSVAIPPKRQSGITYYDGYDYKQIGIIADEVILMAHDYQWKDGSIKATAPYNLVKEALNFAVKDIPREKVLLQISLGPVQWRDGTYYRPSYDRMLDALNGKNPNEKVIEVTPLNRRFDPAAKVGYAYLKRGIYKDGVLQNTIEDEFYYENSLSVAYKQHLAKEYGIKGMSLWYLGANAQDAMSQFFSVRDAAPVNGNNKKPDESLYEALEPSVNSTVSKTKEWRITFNAAIDPRTVDTGIEVWKKEGSSWVRSKITPIVDSKDDKAVLVKTEGGYSPGEYRMFMKDSLKSVNGLKLGKGRVMKFYVRD